MRTLKVHLKVVALFFSVLILFQGCTVYKNQNISLDQAAAAKDKVKIVTKNNQTVKYLNITKINQEYFGFKKVHGDLTKIPIQKEDIEMVRIKDKPMSAVVGILTFLGGLIVVATVGVLIGGGLHVM
ncbi:MAG: hypothetical protein OEM04_09935 [Flavobacteriaceae bacterium]|nr:hypothetical protein [Flavobacteriaceae bacterium]